MAGLRGQVFNSNNLYKFHIELLYKEEKLFCTKAELLNFKCTLTLAKLDIVDSRLVSNGLIF